MSILEDVKDLAEKLEEQIAKQSVEKRIIDDLKKSTGLDVNDQAWSEMHDKYPHQVELLAKVMQDYLSSGDESLTMFAKIIMFMPDSLREVAFDRLIALAAINVHSTIDQINDVLTKKP